MDKHILWRKSLLLLSFFILLLSAADLPAAAADTPCDTQPPTAPGGLSAVNRTFTAISLKWTEAHDNTGVRGYQVYRDGRKIITTSNTSYTNTNLIPGKEYTYVIKAYDAAGNISEGGNTLIAATVPDLQPPSAPGSLSAASNTFTTVILSWKPSTDNTAVKGYYIYLNGGKKASSKGTDYECKGLLPGKIYSFYVRAYDIAGNLSPSSSSISACTTVDKEAPGAPSGLKVQSVSETEMTLAWSPSSDNVKVKEYDVLCDGRKIASVSGTTCRIKGLIPGESHTYTVQALDASGNMSSASNRLSAAALKDLKAPTVPGGLSIVKKSGTSVSLAWTASTDNVKVKGYNVYCNGKLIASTTKISRTVKKPSGLGIGFYMVRAYDLAGNLSPESKYLTVIF